MQKTEESILRAFKENASKELDTTSLAKLTYPNEYAKILEAQESSDKTTVLEAKRRKFQLHRKILYYLNKLVEQDILKIARIQEKGEKIFALIGDEGAIQIEKGYKKIIITKTEPQATYLEHYEHQKIIKRYEESTWINRLNSVLIECEKNPNLTKLYNIIKQIFVCVNDVIALHDFHIIINKHEKNDIKEFITHLDDDTNNLDIIISLIIDIAELHEISGHEFIEIFSQINPKKINLIFEANNKDIHKHTKLMDHIITQFSSKKIKINIKNKGISSAPYLKGRAGMYTFEDNEWATYKKTSEKYTIGVSCSQSAIAININKFFETYNTVSAFRQAILEAAKSLLSANTIQRRKSNEYFKRINQLNDRPPDFFKYSRNYIRFWNYDWHEDIEVNNNLFDLIKSSKELVDNFCYSEETIFKSCGIPIKFKIAFSSAFRNFDPTFMGEREYKKATLKNADDMYKGEIKDFIRIREKMFEIFDGGDRLRIFRTSNFENIDVIHEFIIILSSFKIPFFTYDFSSMHGMVRLTNFMNE